MKIKIEMVGMVTLILIVSLQAQVTESLRLTSHIQRERICEGGNVLVSFQLRNTTRRYIFIDRNLIGTSVLVKPKGKIESGGEELFEAGIPTHYNPNLTKLAPNQSIRRKLFLTQLIPNRLQAGEYILRFGYQLPSLANQGEDNLSNTGFSNKLQLKVRTCAK